MFFLFKNSNLTQKTRGEIHLFMFWHSKSNHTWNWVNISLRRQTNIFFFLFMTLPAWLCGWRRINSSVCATNAEVSKHSWFGAVLQLLHSTTKHLSYKYPKGWLATAKLKPHSRFISLLFMLKIAFDNIKIEKWKVKVVSALQWLASPFNNTHHFKIYQNNKGWIKEMC